MPNVSDPFYDNTSSKKLRYCLFDVSHLFRIAAMYLEKVFFAGVWVCHAVFS